ncbi:hypothetical protein CWC05_15435 [Pseudoalteromonas ruthenica]|uniref:IrrE N-terminal-like domain-containing protein n=1 Tax=Pseudoalteromonas ruthenica TaxID=151081 RepID=A0A5S3Z135_9GAMM|nr:hypothetical protein [Pseudoalteromonas ruthenica]TMP85994.1 hypothetical protein CWC05_15435 [Pseudoalteromonas ruthenica]
MVHTHLPAILQFFDDIELPYRFAPVAEESFLPGINIHQGILVIDKKRLAHEGDLLHEAGHLAVTDRHHRATLSGDVKQWGHQGGEEMAAMAWSWAALQAIGLPPSVVFHEHGYRGAAANLITAFSTNPGPGVPLLYSWFMCLAPEQPQGFPVMQHWFRDDAYTHRQLALL